MARILILEDDVQLSKQIIGSLADAGHTAVDFTDVNAAADYLKTEQVDLMIVDLFIKDSSGGFVFGGISLISQVRQIMRMNVPILAISGSFESDIKLEAIHTSMTVGASATLAKPFHPDELLSSVEDLLKTTS